MYKLVYLPIAKSDIDNIIHYIAINLQNKSTAKKLAESFIDGANSILNFPYGSSIYQPIGILKNEYRSIRIKNFLMFYTIDEKEKLVIVVRVLYQKRNINNILE